MPVIFELRTYDLKTRSVPEVERRFAEQLEKRTKYSKLGASWHTEIGPLNQIVQVWPYDSLEERERVRSAAAKDGVWPPKIDEFVMAVRSDIMKPFPFSPPLTAGRDGPYFEMRTYTYGAGELPAVIKVWEGVLPARLEMGPVTALWYSEFGALNKFVNIWPYKSLDERMEVRHKAHAAGIWPPTEVAEKRTGRSYEVVSIENKILLPASFSPLQ